MNGSFDKPLHNTTTITKKEAKQKNNNKNVAISTRNGDVVVVIQ